MKRVNKGEKFWRIWAMDIRFEICESIDDYGSICTQMYEMGNYFHTQKEAEAMVKKIRTVLKGADVIEGGCIVIHTERCTDVQVEEIAGALADFLTERFPNYAKTIFS